jgi:hypothetical protein
MQAKLFKDLQHRGTEEEEGRRRGKQTVRKKARQTTRE